MTIRYYSLYECFEMLADPDAVRQVRAIRLDDRGPPRSAGRPAPEERDSPSAGLRARLSRG